MSRDQPARSAIGIENRLPIRRGFSLVELLIVVALLGIFAATLIPTTETHVYGQLKTAAQTLAGDLDYVRSLAVTHNSKYTVVFDTSNRRYTIRHTGINSELKTLPVAHRTGVEILSDRQEHRFDFDRLRELIMQVDLQFVQAGTDSPSAVSQVEFTADGSTSRSEPTVVWLAAGHGSSRRYLAVHINPTTGLTTVEGFTATAPGAS